MLSKYEVSTSITSLARVPQTGILLFESPGIYMYSIYIHIHTYTYIYYEKFSNFHSRFMSFYSLFSLLMVHNNSYLYIKQFLYNWMSEFYSKLCILIETHINCKMNREKLH